MTMYNVAKQRLYFKDTERIVQALPMLKIGVEMWTSKIDPRLCHNNRWKYRAQESVKHLRYTLSSNGMLLVQTLKWRKMKAKGSFIKPTNTSFGKNIFKISVKFC